MHFFIDLKMRRQEGFNSVALLPLDGSHWLRTSPLTMGSLALEPGAELLTSKVTLINLGNGFAAYCSTVLLRDSVPHWRKSVLAH